MNKIEEGLHRVHALAGNQAECSNATATIIQDNAQLDPFLKVNLVSPGSPAEIAVRIFLKFSNGYKLTI